ncbi:uncharacterized protein TNIN_222001 [Trichonephila inaurata madagascariensis]|uniref:PID domain-containing protein n=1 Tax=Trichonephila inaurata madagascariensis TaxID=2747483 RepID=A0A8X6XEQ0_9ARAC|nr:uncharacterized protein TNIN_222001 [Trichonephila inaurata madagascariensis]
MKPYILSDRVIYRMKDKFEKEMTLGLEKPDKAILPMTVTFVTDRYTNSAFCSNLSMRHFSLNTAILPRFSEQSHLYPCQKDVKAYFEQILSKQNYQGNSTVSVNGTSIYLATEENSSSAIHHAEFDAKYLGSENILGIDANPELCHKILGKMTVFLNTGHFMRDVVLDIGHTGIRIQDKSFKDLLYHHPLNKISYITQDFINSSIFGYIFGDYVKGHKFFGFKTTCESTQVILFLQELFQVELMQRKKEELDMKASQVFLTLKNFLNVAQDLKAKEREIPVTLKKRVSLVENIFWWLEGCCGDITPVYLDREEWTLNVRIPELYTTAVTMKLIEKEQEEARIRAEKAAAKRHMRKKVEEVEEPKEEPKKKLLPPSSNLKKVVEILKGHTAFLKSIQENRKHKIISFEENIAKLRYDDIPEALILGAVISLEKLRMKIEEERKTEISNLKQKIESFTSIEYSEKENLQFKKSKIYFGNKQFLKSIQMKPKENIFEKISLHVPKRSLEVSEISNQIKMCKDYFLNALKIRKEEINELNYFINCLHFREHQLPSKESAVVMICRQLLVKLSKMRMREVRSVESILVKLIDTEEDIVFAVPKVYSFSKDVYTSFLQELEDQYNLFQAITLKIPDVSEFDVYLIPDYKEFYQELKQLGEADIQKVEETISKFQDREHFIDIEVFSLCSKLFKNAVEDRKKEFDELVNDLDLLEATEVDDADFERPKVLVSLRDIFYAALELEKKQYEKILLSDSERNDEIDEVLPVVYSLKDIFEVVSLGLKQKHNQESDDPTTAKNLEIYSTLEEFLSMTFDFKQKEVEIPFADLKKDLENILSSMIRELKERESKRILECKRHLQALKIMNSWKEVFLMAARLRKAEIMKVVPAKIKESKEEEVAMRMMKKDQRLNVDTEGRLVASSWRIIFTSVINMKRNEFEQIKKLLMKPEEQDKEVKEKEDERPTFIEVNDDEYLEEKEDTEEESPHSELLRVMAICRLIFQTVINKGTAELEEMEYDMSPLFNHEYDEENIELEVDEITSALNKAKQVFQDFNEISKAREAVLTTSVETLTFLRENIGSQVSIAQETSKRYLLTELEEEENEVFFIRNNVKMLDEAFEGLISKPSEELRSFTDLVIDVLNSDHSNAVKEKQDENPNEQQETVEKEKSPVFTPEQIESLLLEIEAEQKGDEEEKEDPQKLKALALYQSCKNFLLTAAEYRNKNREIVKSKLEKMEKLQRKKLKKKKKLSQAKSDVKDCMGILNDIYETIQTEIKFVQNEIYEMAKAYPVDQGTTDFKSSDIVAVFRKLFSSFVEVRQNNVNSMKVELGLLQAKENSFSSEKELNESDIDSLKTETLEVCKNLVIGSVDLKMKEVDEIESQFDPLNESEQKIEALLNELDTEEMKASYTKLEKVKDAVDTCKRLCISAIEKAKKGVRDADEELKMLKDVLDASEDSVVKTTCIYLLQSGIDCKENEIYACKKVKKKLEKYLENLVVTEEEMLEYLNNSPVSEALPSEVKSEIVQHVASKGSLGVVFTNVEDIESESVEKIFDEADGKESAKFISSADLGEEVKNAIKVEKVKGFFEEGSRYINERKFKSQDEIDKIEADLDKLKITIQNVEKEDSEVFEICCNAILLDTDVLRMESQNIENELQSLNKLSIENLKNTEDVEFAANCKRTLMNGVKNRKAQHTVIEFELMKLVRYQDSRITTMCKDELIYLQEIINREIHIIREKVKRLERSNKIELLEICKKLSQEFMQLVNSSIHLTESILQSVTEKKTKIELEDAQFVAVCKDVFHSHIVQRKKEISLKQQTIDQIADIKLVPENLDSEVDFVYKMCTNLCDFTMETRYKEIERIECELIKQMKINVSESISECEQYFLEITEVLKNNLLTLKKETEEIQLLRLHFWKMNEDEFVDLIGKHKEFTLSVMQRNLLEEKMLKKKINIFKGKQDSSSKTDEINLDALNIFNQEASQKKLQTEAFDMLSMCKGKIFYTIENFDNEMKNLKKALEELKSHRTNTKQPMKTLSEILPSAHTYTPKQIALLEELEQEILDSESCKEELEFCVQLYLTAIDRKKEKIAAFRQILGKINAAEYDLNSEAAELIFGWRNLCSAFCDSLTVQNEVFENDLAKFENAKQLMEEQEISIEYIEEMLKHTTSLKESILGNVLVKLQDLKAKKLKLSEEVSRTRVKCRQLLEEFIEGLEDDLKYSVYSFESLKNCINGLEENIDEAGLSDAQKIVENCKKCFKGLIETRKKGIHAVNLERKFLIRNYEESNIEKSTVLPSWQERFLLFVGLDKEEYTANKKTPIIQGSLMQNSEKQVKSTTETSGAVAKSTDRAKLIKYQDLMQSLIHKSKKQPPYIISSWNDILSQSFLIEKLERLKRGNERKMFQVEKTWDDLLLDVTKIVSRQEKVSALLFTEKETFIQLSSWMNILTEAVDSWNAKIREGLAPKAHEITLLKWKSKMKEKEYSKFVAGYMYGTEDETQMEFTDTKNFTLDLKTLTTALSNVESKEGSSNDNKQKSPDQSSWEEIFTDAIHVIKEGIKLISILKTQDSKVQFQSSRLHLSWNDCFFKAVEIWKEKLKKQVAEDDVLNDVAQKVKNKILGGNQEEAVRFEVEQSKVWTQKIFEVFHIHKQELAKAINIKKLEVKQGLTANLHIEFEDKTDHNPIYAKEVTTDIIKQGQRMFNIALDLKKKETKAMEAELNLLKEAGNQDDHDVQKIPKPLEIMQNIIATAIDFKKEGLQLPQQIKKYFSKSSDDLFEISKKSLAKELESNVHYQGKFQENIHLNEKEITSWDQVYQCAYDLIAKDLEKIQKFGLKGKTEEPDANRQYLDLMAENLPHWTDIFLDAASEIIKEMNPNQLDRMNIFEQHLQSQVLPSWNEILFIMYNYSMKTIQKKLFTDDIGTLADAKDISNIKSMVVHDEFDLDHIILAVIEEFLKNYCDVCKGDEDLGSDKTAELHDLEKKFDKNNVSKQEEDETNNKYMKGYTWIDLLPSKDIEKKFQLEEELLETKAKLENSVSSFKDEKIPNDLIWKHIFPLAVLVWKKKKLGDYLNFQKMSANGFSNVSVPYSKAYELELLKIKLNQERERLKKFTDNVARKSKKLISEQFNLPNDDSTSDVMPSSLDSEHDSNTENDIYSMLQFREDEKFENLEPQAFDVIDIFKSILHEGLFTRRKELSLLEQELWKLESEEKDVQKDKASSALRILWKYYNVAAKFRDKENKKIAFELENLNELKDMFQEYVDFSVNEAMQQRNKKQIRSMKHSYQEIQMLQSDLDHKLISHLDRCVNHCNSLLEKRRDKKFLVDIQTVDSLLGRLDLKDQEIFMAAKNILVSIADLRKTEIKTIERDIFKVKKKDLFKGSLENKLSEFLSSFIVSISKGFEERNHLQNLLEDGMNLLNEAKNNVSARVCSCSKNSLK